MERNNLYAKWGVLLGRIIKETGGKKKDIHQAILRAIGASSLKDLSDDELFYLINDLVAHMASEYGIEIYFDKHNSDYLEKMSLGELFEYYGWITKNH